MPPSSNLTEGLLVLADISGYTRFVAGTEIEHSGEIVNELLDTIVRSVKDNLEPVQVEGDCILFTGPVDESAIVPLLESSFIAFHRRLRAMATGTTCPCDACRRIGGLTVKYVVHRGTYSRTRVGNVEQLHGADVIAAFRLLKNSVPEHEYLLVTAPVLARLPEPAPAAFVSHSEEYEHLGRVEGGFTALAPVWARAVSEERTRVEPHEAQIKLEYELEAPPETVWRIFGDPDAWRRCLGANDVVMVPGARGSYLDTEFHCHHGRNNKGHTYFRVVAQRPPDEATYLGEGAPLVYHQTVRVEDLGGGRSKVTSLFQWDVPPGIRGMITSAAMKFFLGQGIRPFPARARAEVERLAKPATV